MNMDQLVKKLNEAAKAYYSESDNIMSDKEYDELYDQLKKMEEVLGIVLPNSPTKRVGYEVVSSLEKVTHEYPALSLDKTKEVSQLKKWLGDKTCIVTPKMDGLTLVLTYEPISDEKSVLKSAVTRGNGIIGENVLHNVKYIDGIPMEIPYNEKITVRGEVVISYPDFLEINALISAKGGEPYKNPRNLASGSLRLYDSKEASTRRMHFKAFTLVNPYIEKGNPDFETMDGCYFFLWNMGFDVVPYVIANTEKLQKAIDTFDPNNYPYPMDGLVLTYNEIDRSIGTTGKYPKYAMAFKWRDETEETILRDVFWSASKTGLLNPVAIFDPVELEGTTVKKASIHNLSMIKKLNLSIGDHITIYKANKIIPQIDENLTGTESHLEIPNTCPVCGHELTIETGKNGSEFLMCKNPDCAAKHLGKFERMVDRDALNVVGLSSSILEQFLSLGFIHEMSDLFHLEKHREDIVKLEGFGDKSFDKIIKAVETARKTTFRRMFYSLGIPGAGRDVAKILDNYFSSNEEYASLGIFKSRQLPLFIKEDLYDILDDLNGIGETLADSMVNWFGRKSNFEEYLRFINELEIEDDKVIPTEKKSLSLEGKTFVITGSLNHYENRNALKAEIESLGGKVSSSVSKKTSYLINNDVTSTSGKNKKAHELGIPIISEEDFLIMKEN